jgi:2-oxoisovalerate dehydrogenase E1 component
MQNPIELFKALASKELNLSKLKENNISQISKAILIREVENSFLDLFNQGQMNGTVHTCVGQEFSGVAISSALNSRDWITSNHRCHGHFIAKTNQWKELIDELRGFESGVCKGIGSSQHLFTEGFLSNGPQAALIPVGSGIAKHLKDTSGDNVCVSFFGEGTFGEGLIYESMNLASVLELPQVFVLENNLYSQSTPQTHAVSGSFELRAKAFDLEFFSANTWDLEDLFLTCKQAIEYSRLNQKPCFLEIKTYRLNAHSKSDDDRDEAEIKFFLSRDPINQFKESGLFEDIFEDVKAKVESHILSTKESILSSKDYFHDQLPRKILAKTKAIENPNERMINQLNLAYKNEIQNGSYFIGEDIVDPYGGAFKVSKDLSTLFPDKVIGTPISEGAITGLGIGLSMMGNKSYVEIMFGDFMSYAFDQILSNASKFYHMYAFQCSAPIRIRTPMGGKRGYGPTHSQSLEKFFLGMDNVAVFSLSSIINPLPIIEELRSLDCPVIILENKVDYAKKLFQENEFLIHEQVGGPFGPVLVKPKEMDPDITIISYGGTAREIADGFVDIFEETGFISQVICLSSLNPLNLHLIMGLIKKTKNIVTVEDHSVGFGIGAEIFSTILSEDKEISFKRIGAEPYPIPSIRSLEDGCLPTIGLIIKELKSFKKSLKN